MMKTALAALLRDRFRAQEQFLERLPGLQSSSAMSIENLNTAVRAAGFAMAPSDESDETKSAKQVQSEAWRPGEAIVLSHDDVETVKAAPSIADRLKGVFGLLGRGAPA
jgi:hypothetical protein